MDLYVLIVSDHNLAELRACLHYKPRYIWLVASNKMQQAAQRLFGVLKKQCTEAQIEILQALAHVPFEGNTLQETDAWLRQVFVPKIGQFNASVKCDCVLNMTGGTKTLSYLLTRAYDWQEIHYQPFGNKVILERFCLSAQDLEILPYIDLANVTISPKDNALLYMDFVRSHTPNPMRKHTNSLPVALSRLKHAPEWKKLTDLLEEGWQQTSTAKFVSIACSQAINTEFVCLLNSVSSHQHPPLTLSHNALTMPSPNHKDYKDWFKWVSLPM